MKILTSRERLDRCFRHLETDRPGINLRGFGFNKPKDITYAPLKKRALEECDIVEGYNLPEIEGTTHMAFFNQKNNDRFTFKKEQHNDHLVKYSCIVHTPTGNISQEYMVGNSGQGYIVKNLIETTEDAERYLTLDYPALEPNFDDYFKLDRKVGDRGIVVVKPCYNPAGCVTTMLGSERFAIWSIDHREMLHRLMEHRRDYILDIVKILIENNVGPYFGFAGHEEIAPPLHGAKDFYDFNVKYDKPIMDLIHNSGGLVKVHCHGSLKKVLDGFLDIGVDVLHPIEPPPMGDVTAKEAKEKFRGKICIEGNIQIGDMYTLNSDEIKVMIENLINDAYDDQEGLIVCQSASPYIRNMSKTVYDNYNIMIDTVLNL